MTELTADRTGAAVPAPPRRGTRTAAGEGPAYWFFGGRAVIRTPPDASPIVIEMSLPPGGHAPLHVHHDVDDSYYLLSGRVAVRCGDDTFVARSGDYVSLPEGVPHTFFVLDGAPAVMLQTHKADGFLRFIEQAGQPADRDAPPDDAPPDLPALYEIAAATGQPVLGPPMSEAEAAEILAADNG